LAWIELGGRELASRKSARLRRTRRCCFNLSHTNVACALTTVGVIGVDFEEVHAVPLDVADTLFGPPEIEALRAAGSGGRRDVDAQLDRVPGGTLYYGLCLFSVRAADSGESSRALP
jgi:hypothetical protein